jgi:hypothetical protein
MPEQPNPHGPPPKLGGGEILGGAILGGALGALIGALIGSRIAPVDLNGIL